jgi:anti-anti-sigma factor
VTAVAPIPLGLGAESTFTVQTDDREPLHPVVYVRGELDMATAPQLADSIAGVLSRIPSDVVLDLSDTTFMDASGITVIVRMRNHLGDSSRVIIRHPAPVIRRILKLVQIDTVVTIDR